MHDPKLQPTQAHVPTPVPVQRPPQQDIDDFIFSHDQPPAASSR